MAMIICYVAIANSTITKILVWGIKQSGQTIFSRLKLVWGTKFGCQNWYGLTKMVQCRILIEFIATKCCKWCEIIL